MSPYLTLVPPTAKDNSLAGASADAVDVAALLRFAVESLACPHKVAADAVGYNPDYWSRVLTNDRGIVLNRLGRLPVIVQRELVLRWADALGLPLGGSEQIAELAELLTLRKVKI